MKTVNVITYDSRGGPMKDGDEMATRRKFIKSTDSVTQKDISANMPQRIKTPHFNWDGIMSK